MEDMNPKAEPHTGVVKKFKGHVQERAMAGETTVEDGASSKDATESFNGSDMQNLKRKSSNTEDQQEGGRDFYQYQHSKNVVNSAKRYRKHDYAIPDDFCNLPPENVLRDALLMLESKEKDGITFGVKIGGKFYDCEGIQKCLNLHQIRGAKGESGDEDAWFEKLLSHVEQPKGTKAVDLEAVKEFLSVIRDHEHIYSTFGLSLSANHLKSLVGTRPFEGAILQHMSKLINSQSAKTYAVFLNEVSDAVSFISAIKSKFPTEPPDKIIFSMSVGLVGCKTILKSEAGSTDDCHFSFGVYFRHSNAFYYGDPFGYPAPSELLFVLEQVLQGVYDSHHPCKPSINCLHYNSEGNSSLEPLKHICNSDCWEHYHLQCESHICGVSVVITMCLITFDEGAFLSLHGTSKQCSTSFSYLKHTLQYNDFLRVSIIKWILKGSITVASITPVTQIKSAADSKSDLTESYETIFDLHDRLMSTKFISNVGGKNGICKHCSGSSQHFHCNLCPHSLEFPNRSKAISHVNLVHLNVYRIIKVGTFQVVPCRKHHGGIASKKSHHYHCPYCTDVVHGKHQFKVHLESHVSKENANNSKSIDVGHAPTKPSSTLSKHCDSLNEAEIVYGRGDNETRLAAANFKDSNEPCFQIFGSTTVNESIINECKVEASTKANGDLSANDTQTTDCCQTIFDLEEHLTPAAFVGTFGGSNEVCRQCSVSAKHYHCKLCPSESRPSPKSVLMKHIARTHLSTLRIVSYGEFQIIPCKQNHPNTRPRRECHFHCPYCPAVGYVRRQFLTHLESHTTKIEQQSSVCRDSVFGNEQVQTNLMSNCNKSDIVRKSLNDAGILFEANRGQERRETTSASTTLLPVPNEPVLDSTAVTKVEGISPRRPGNDTSSTSTHDQDVNISCQTVFDSNKPLKPTDFASVAGGRGELCRRCTVTEEHFHCRLCSPVVESLMKGDIIKHVEQVHFNELRVICIGEFTVIPCRLYHFGARSSNKNHYHCPYCPSVVVGRELFQTHLGTHARRSESPSTDGKKDVLSETQPQAKNSSMHEKEKVICETLTDPELLTEVKGSRYIDTSIPSSNDTSEPSFKRLGSTVVSEYEKNSFQGFCEDQNATDKETGDCCRSIFDVKEHLASLDFLYRIGVENGICKQCSARVEHFHCKLCPPASKYTSKSKAVDHAEREHLNLVNTVRIGEYRILPCKQYHFGIKSRKKYHYHCPYCPSHVQKKKGFLRHLGSHLSRLEADNSECKAVGPNKSQPPTNMNEPELFLDDNGICISMPAKPTFGAGLSIIKTNDLCKPSFDNSSTGCSTNMDNADKTSDGCFQTCFDSKEEVTPPDFLDSIDIEKGTCAQCTERRKHFHCRLCPAELCFMYKSLALKHLSRSHFRESRIIRTKAFTIFSCKQRHPGISHSKKYHYHCPYCPDLATRKERIHKHMELHAKRTAKLVAKQRTKSKNAKVNENSSKAEASSAPNNEKDTAANSKEASTSVTSKGSNEIDISMSTANDIISELFSSTVLSDGGGSESNKNVYITANEHAIFSEWIVAPENEAIPLGFLDVVGGAYGICKQCSILEKHFHCKLCSPELKFVYKSKAIRHVMRGHLNAVRIVCFGEHTFIPCKLNHLGGKVLTKYHYHCSHCPSFLQGKGRFLKHLQSHTKKTTKQSHIQSLAGKKLEQELKLNTSDTAQDIETSNGDVPSQSFERLGFSVVSKDDKILESLTNMDTSGMEIYDPFRTIFHSKVRLKMLDFVNVVGEDNEACALCSDLEKHLHCRLCSPDSKFFFKSTMLRHLKHVHFNASRTVRVGEYAVLPCKQFHSTAKSEQCHYHCPFCPHYAVRISRLQRHILLHKSKGQSSKGKKRRTKTGHKRKPDKTGSRCKKEPAQANQPARTKPSPIPAVDDVSNDSVDMAQVEDDYMQEMDKVESNIADTTPERNYRQMGECFVCGKTMVRKSISKHIRAVHPTWECFRTVYYDRTSGLFIMPSSSSRGSDSIQVQTVLQGWQDKTVVGEPDRSGEPPELMAVEFDEQGLAMLGAGGEETVIDSF